MISLREAREAGRLDEFVAQEETRGVGPVDQTELDAALSNVIKSPQSKDQTSRSPSRGGLTGM